MHLYCKLPDDFKWKKSENISKPPTAVTSKTTTRTTTTGTTVSTVINSPPFTPLIVSEIYNPYPTPFDSKTGTPSDADRILNTIPTPNMSFKIETARSIPKRPSNPVPSHPATPPDYLPERPVEPSPPPTAVQQLVLPSPIETPPPPPPRTPTPPPPESPPHEPSQHNSSLPHSPIVVQKKEEDDEYLTVPNDLKHPLDKVMKKYIDSQRDIEMPEKMFKEPIYELNSLAPVFGEYILYIIE